VQLLATTLRIATATIYDRLLVRLNRLPIPQSRPKTS
jgi:hypothetical protein